MKCRLALGATVAMMAAIHAAPAAAVTQLINFTIGGGWVTGSEGPSAYGIGVDPVLMGYFIVESPGAGHPPGNVYGDEVIAAILDFEFVTGSQTWTKADLRDEGAPFIGTGTFIQWDQYGNVYDFALVFKNPSFHFTYGGTEYEGAGIAFGGFGSNSIGGGLVTGDGYTDICNRICTGSLSRSVTFTAPPGDTGVPEPSTWAMMLAGFALMGATLRRRRVALA